MPGNFWGGAGEAIASPIPAFGIAKAVFGRKNARRQKSFEKARMKAAVAGAERDVAEFEQNAPIQQAQLAQSLASRGLGTSSIQEQDTRNLTATQGRQRAAVNENLDLTRRGYSLWRKQQKHAKRMGPLAFWEALTMRVGKPIADKVVGDLPGATG